MPLDDDLRAALTTMTDRRVDVGIDLATVRVTARRTRRRRVTTTIVAVAVAALASTALVLRSHDSSRAHVSTPANTGPAPTTGPLPSTSSLAPTTSTVPPTTLPLGSIAQDLTFSGTYNGHITVAAPANSGEVLGPHLGPDPTLPAACTNALPAQTGADGAVIGIVAALRDQRLLLYYSVGDIHDPQAGLHEAVAAIGGRTLTFDAANVTVDQDRNGASLDSDLYYYANGSRIVVGHVTGHFRCAP